MRSISTVFFVALALASHPSVSPGQTLWSDPARPQSIWLQALHPDLESGSGSGFLSSGLFLGGRVDLSEDCAFVGEIPFGYADLDDGDSEFGVGNPYAGLEFGPSRGLLVEFGARVPLASNTNNGAAIGGLADLVDRPGAFASDALTISAAVNSLASFEKGGHTRLRVGAIGLVPTDGGDQEVLLDVGATVGYEDSSFGAEAGLDGWIWLTQSDLDLGERSVVQFGAQAYHRLAAGGRVGVQFRLPLDRDLKDITDFTVGLDVSFAL